MREHRSDCSWEEADDRVIVSGAGLRLVFARTGERWTHRLELAHGGGIAVARAVEGELEPGHHDARRIVSPLYQELHRHELAQGPGLCLLLTGRLSHHHFSAAVSLRVDPARPECFILDFDVADRCRVPLDCLAATYLVGLESIALVAADPRRMAWGPLGPDRGRLELRAEGPGSLAFGEAGPRAARVQALARLGPGTFTHRLRYQWRWTSSADRTR